jgi:predicted N-acetyltransferase YhbS
MSFLEAEYSSWIRTTSGISQKGQSDLISRLRRADHLEPLDKFIVMDDYQKAVTSVHLWGSIPKKTQEGMLAASRRYFKWLDSRNRS